MFGLLGLIVVVRFAAHGWISRIYLEPAHHLSYYGFGWVQAWPGWGIYLHFALLGLASLGVATGYRYRLSITAFFGLFTYIELIDRTTYLNHYYLVSLLSFIMIWLPMGRAWALDSKKGLGSSVAPEIPRAVLWLLMAQVGLVYFFAGVAKLNPDWLFQAQPLRIWLYNSADIPFLGPFLREAWVAYAFSWGGMIFDLTIAGWLLWSRSRPFAYGMLVVFHAATALLFPSIGMFPWIMIAVALIFFGPDWPRRAICNVRNTLGPTRRSNSDIPKPNRERRHITWQTKSVVLLGVVFLAIQIALPLRHFAYPGNVHWAEEGYLFSWRVMLTEKKGHVLFRVRALGESREWLVYPDAYLTPGQVERMSYQPDLILATAHIIRDDWVSRGYSPVQVYSDAYASWNGRPAARLIDPSMDLAEVGRVLGPRDWVLSAPGPPDSRQAGNASVPHRLLCFLGNVGGRDLILESRSGPAADALPPTPCPRTSFSSGRGSAR